jgi:hypothetical protein
VITRASSILSLAVAWRIVAVADGGDGFSAWWTQCVRNFPLRACLRRRSRLHVPPLACPEPPPHRPTDRSAPRKAASVTLLGNAGGAAAGYLRWAWIPEHQIAPVPQGRR